MAKYKPFYLKRKQKLSSCSKYCKLHYYTEYERVDEIITRRFYLEQLISHRRKEHSHFEIRGVEWHNCSETADSFIPVQL